MTTTTTTSILSTIVAAVGVCTISWLLQLLKNRLLLSKACKGPKRRPRFGPRTWPLLGSVPGHVQNWSRLHDWLCTYFEKYHTITAIMHCGQHCYYTVDVENIKYILKTNFKNFPKGNIFGQRMEVLLGSGIFNADGEKWKLQRKIASAEFTVRAMRDFYRGAFTVEALKLVHIVDQFIQQGVPVDMQDLFMRMTLESIGKVGFGVEIGTLPSQLPLPENPFAKAFDLANSTVFWRFIDPTWKLWRSLNVGYEADLAKAVKVIDSFTYGVIAQRKLDLSKARKQQAEGAPMKEIKKDIITRFILLAEEEGSKIDMKMLRDIVLNFVIAGRDTTAVTLSWFLYCIVQKPEVAQRIYDELRAFEIRMTTTSEDGPNVLENGSPDSVDDKIGRFSKLLTVNNIKPEELPYLQAVLSETLRLYPAVPVDAKGIEKDDVLPDGTHLRAGMIIVYCSYGMGRMTYIWGPDAREFKPERWLRNGQFVPESEFKFTAFQAGLRTCLGRESAYIQMKITAAILCRFYEFQLVQGHKVHYAMMPILAMINGLKVHVKRREEPIIAKESESNPSAS